MITGLLNFSAHEKVTRSRNRDRNSLDPVSLQGDRGLCEDGILGEKEGTPESPVTPVQDVRKSPAKKLVQRNGKRKLENIEDIYLNKHYKKPTEKLWETIYEDADKGLSKKRLRRSINFDMNTVPAAKVKRRAQKASKLGFGPSARRKLAIPQHEFELKLKALQEELGDMESP